MDFFTCAQLGRTLLSLQEEWHPVVWTQQSNSGSAFTSFATDLLLDYLLNEFRPVNTNTKKIYGWTLNLY